MTESLFALAVILLLTIGLPLFLILHFVTRWKQSREFSKDDEDMLEELWTLSQRLEDRITTLERILDDDQPQWRKR